MIKVDITGMSQAVELLGGLGKKVNYAAARALNNLAFAANAQVKQEMQAKFKGGATPYSLRAFSVAKARRDNLVASVELRTDNPGKSRAYDKVLGHLFSGGTRRWKRMEGAFRRIGVLPAGYMMTVPRSASWSNPLDAYGNAKPSFITQLISYFGGYGEQGFRANMTDKRRGRLAKRGVSAAGFKIINGVAYFISRGRGMWFGRRQHLAAGIWAKRGTHGADIAPVFLFVRAGRWHRVIDLDAIGASTADQWQVEFDRELAAERGLA